MPDAEASISEEPGARKRHAGICAGAVWATGRPTAMTADPTGKLPENLVKSIKDSGEFLFRGSSDALTDSID